MQGFWRRSLAHLVDFMIFVPLLVLQTTLQGTSRAAAIAAVPVSSVLYLSYSIGLHALFGQTIGKRVARIRVTRTDGTSISWHEASLRNSVEIVFSSISVIGAILILLHLPDAFFTLSWIPRSKAYMAAKPSWLVWLHRSGNAYFWSELVVMLTNSRRRAIHDFIAGTIVVTDARG